MSQLPRLKSVAATGPQQLTLGWRSGAQTMVDVSGAIAVFEALAPLRDGALFGKAELADWGAAVAWPGDVAMSAQSLWRMSEEQLGFSPENFRHWQAALKLSLSEAADVLGVSPATVKKYRREGPISAAVSIAARAMQNDPALLAAHLRPRRRGRPKAA